MNQFPTYFLLSSTRAGSTLLSRILNGHPEVACPFEFMIPYLLYPLHWKRRQAKAKMKKILQHYDIHVPYVWRWTGFPLRRNLQIIIQKICDAEGKRIFVAKDPFYARVLEKVVRLFPNSKYIILTRHPLKVAQSIEDAWQNDQGLMMWALHYESILEHKEQIDNVTVRYEDLVTQPDETLQSVCDYIGVDFTPEMVHYSLSHHTGDELNLWGVTGTVERVSRTLKSLRKGQIDPSLAKVDLKKIDRKYKVQFRKNAYRAREIAESFGYELPT